MAPPTPLAWLYGSSTQGSADAFIQTTLATALAGQTTEVAQVREVQMEFTGAIPIAASQYEFEIGLKSAAAVSTLADKTVLFRYKWGVDFATSGAVTAPLIYRFTFDDQEGFYLVTDPIYVRFDTNGTSNTNTCYWRIGYELVKINANDRLTALTNALT